MNAVTAALDGIRILDFTHVYQGPVGTQLLADHGADVIKIERPGSGDWSRSWGPFVEGVSLPFVSLNRNKRSVALDLKAEAGKKIVLQLVETADVLVHNFRPSVMERLGLGYEDLKDVNPRLIYARSSGWGDEGPYADRGRPGHNVMALASAGWFQAMEPDGIPQPVGMSVDYPTGLMLIVGILMALVGRERTGQGRLVSTDLFSVAFHAHTWTAAAELNNERIEDETGIGVTERAIDKSFRTIDGLIQLSPVFSANALRDISLAMGLVDLSQDARFCTEEKLLACKDELNAILAERFLEKSTEEWISILEPLGVLCGEIKTFREAADDPQIRANRMVVEMNHAKLGSLRVLGTPLRLNGTPLSYRMAAPELGEHTREVLAELGYTEDEMDRLAREGVLG